MTAVTATDPAPTTQNARAQWLGRWGLLLGWALLTFFLVVPPRDAMTPDLDASNHGSYAWMLATHQQFGTDVVPMTGPYGFLFYGITYSGYLFTARLIGDLLLKAVFSFIVFRLFIRTGSGFARWLWLVGLVIFLPNVDDMVYDIGILLSGLFLLLSASDRPRGADYVAMLLLGFLSLLKGNHLVLSALTVVLVMLRGGLLRQPAWIIRPALGWLGTMLIFWLAAGQDPRHLPAYLRGILELASGYNNAMAYDESTFWFVTGISVAGGYVLTLLGAAAWIRQWHRLPLLLFFAGFGYMKWKHGYVRADGHIFIFFFAMTLLLPAFWLTLALIRPAPGNRALRLFTSVAGTATFILTVMAACNFWDQRFYSLFRDMPVYVARNYNYLRAPRDYQARLDRELEHNRIDADLPQVRNEVGRGTIDFFGFEQGILLLNGLNYHPRPMGGGSFNVYTRYLQRLNEAFVRDPRRRPAFQLTKLRTLDDRFPTADDPLTLETLLHLYSPVLIQREYLLLQNRGPDTLAPHPEKMREVTVAPGIRLNVPDPGPDKLLLFTVSTPPSLLGRLRAFLYRPSELRLEVVTDLHAQIHTYRLIPELASVPVILSPLLEDNLDLIQLYGHDPGRKVVSLALLPQDPAMFAAGDFRVTFYSLPRPAAPVGTDVEEIITQMKHPLYNREPLSLTTEATGIRELNKEPVTLVHAPGQISFPLEPGDQQVIFSYGLMPQAYDPGQTDGVEFFVETDSPNGPVNQVFHRYLQPLTNPDDRGMQRAHVYLPGSLPPGSVVRIRTETGPTHNGAWDQSYITRLQIKQGLADPRQSFGFNVAPLPSGFAPNTEFDLDGRPVRGVHPPTELLFPIPTGARRLIAGIGIMPGAYQGDNRTDGVEFTFALRRPDGSTEVIGRRLLDPINVTADRGIQTLELRLPVVPEGCQLVFRTGPGPHGNLSWDWAVLQTLQIE